MITGYDKGLFRHIPKINAMYQEVKVMALPTFKLMSLKFMAKAAAKRTKIIVILAKNLSLKNT